MKFWSEAKHFFRKKDAIIFQIIAINFTVFVLFASLRVIGILTGKPDIYTLVLRQFLLSSSASTVLQKPWTFFSYFFIHSDFFDFAFNSLLLVSFGGIIVNLLKNKHLLFLYVVGAVFSGLFSVLIFNSIPYLNTLLRGAFFSGAEGAIAAVIVGAATLIPETYVEFVLIGRIKLKIIAGLYVLVNFLMLMPTIDVIMLLSGALFGFSYISQLKKGRDWSRFFSFLEFKKSPPIPTKKEKIVMFNQPYSRTPPIVVEKISEEELNNILDKISTKGIESLTPFEKKQLEKYN